MESLILVIRKRFKLLRAALATDSPGDSECQWSLERTIQKKLQTETLEVASVDGIEAWAVGTGKGRLRGSLPACSHSLLSLVDAAAFLCGTERGWFTGQAALWVQFLRKQS